MRMDQLLANYFDTEKEVRLANRFYDRLENIIKWIEQSDNVSLELLAGAWADNEDKEDVGTIMSSYTLGLLGRKDFSRNDYEKIRDAFSNLKQANIDRSIFKDIISKYLPIFEKAKEDAQKKCEDAKNKIAEAYNSFIKRKFASCRYATTVFRLAWDDIIEFLLLDDHEIANT